TLALDAEDHALLASLKRPKITASVGDQVPTEDVVPLGETGGFLDDAYFIEDGGKIEESGSLKGDTAVPLHSDIDASFEVARREAGPVPLGDVTRMTPIKLGPMNATTIHHLTMEEGSIKDMNMADVSFGGLPDVS